MKKLLIAGTVAALALASQANAAVTISSSTGYAFDATGFAKVITFDESAPTYTITGSATKVTGNSSGNYAAPATGQNANGTFNYDTTTYLAVQPQSATLSNFGTYTTLSLYWGSIDSYNSVDLLFNGTLLGTVTGTQASADPNGNQQDGITNRRVTISSTQGFNQVRFNTGQNAFELDNVAFNGAVPEPATWAMMLVGFAMVGAVARRRPAKSLAHA